MKIYIGPKNIEDSSYKSISSIQMLSYLADDSECTTIVLDGVLSKQNLNEVINALSLCSSKLRLGGKLQIIDIDFDILTYVYGKNQDIQNLNSRVFQLGPINSLLTLELVKQLCVQVGLTIGSISLNNIDFVLECTRK